MKPPPRYDVCPPLDDRVMNSRSPVGRTLSSTCAALAPVPARSITPALANELLFPILATRATTCVSPLTGWCTKVNESDDPQMSALVLVTVKVPDENDADPGAVAAMSSLTHGLGSDPPPPVPPVVNAAMGEKA